MSVPIFPRSLQHLFLPGFFFYYGHHNGREVVSHVILICISLMTDNVTHLFVCLLAVCVFGEVPTLILCPLFNWVFVFSLLSWKSSSYVLDTRPSSDTWFADIFSCGLWFCFLYRVLGHKIYILKVNWFEGGKWGCCTQVWQKKNLKMLCK